MSTALQALEIRLQDALGRAVIGLEPVIRALAVAIVARGHILLQGPPGLGKTLLSKTLAGALGGAFKRVQGTADLMPSDITGVHIFDTAKNEFVFHPGPIFADVLLVDEINRAGPKTQSALLEAMEERHVTIDRHHYALPADFLVIATQNPREFEGTYPLPESQLDRFMLRLEITYPSRRDEESILDRYGARAAPAGAVPPDRAESPDRTAQGAAETSASTAGAAETSAALAAARADADALHVAPELVGYVLDLVKASRENSHISVGISTRGALAMLRAARIAAALRGASFVAPDDVKDIFPWVVPHRLVLAPEAQLEGLTEQAISRRLLDQVPVPR
jgi:MoxR-like ATPase